MYTAQSVDHDPTTKSLMRRIPIRRLVLPFIVLVIGVGLSITAKKLVDYKVQADLQMEFDKSVNSLYSRAQSGFSKQEQVLHNLDGLFKASVQVVRDVFELYSTIPANSEPGILSIAYANRVSQSQLSDLVLYNKSEGYMNYQVHPLGQRSVYEPVSYVVPADRNKHICGLDLLSNPYFADAILRAHANNRFAATPTFKFRGGDTSSLVLMKAVEKKKSASAMSSEADMLMSKAGDRFDGIVYVELDVKAFMHGIIGDTVGSDKNIVYEFKTADLNGQAQSVYQSPNYASSLSSPALLSTERTFGFGDKSYIVSFRNSPSLGNGFQSNLGWITLASGLLLSLALFGFLFSVVSSHHRAMQLADNITARNRRILELSRDIIATMSQQGVWQAVNPAVYTILGYETEEFENRHISQFFVNNAEFETLLPQLLTSDTERDVNFDVAMKTKSGEVRWISWCFTSVPSEQNIYCNGRDITDARAAEEQIKLKSKQLAIAEQQAVEASEFKSTFMIKLTDRVRGSLADSLMNLHKISSNMDFTDDNQLQFLKLANQSSDQLYNIVSDLLEVARGTAGSFDQHCATVIQCLQQTQHNLREQSSARAASIITTGLQSDQAVAVDPEILSTAFTNVIAALSEGSVAPTVEVVAEENTVEGVLELQLLAPANEHVSSMIEQYNSSLNNLIDDLHLDQDNIMFRLGVAASQFRRMNCSVSIASLGVDGNVVLLTIPAVKAISTTRQRIAEYH